MRFCALRTQSPPASVATMRGSSPRLCRYSMSSTQACGFLSFAARSKRSSRRVSRQASSRSTSMPTRSSNDRLVLAVSVDCSSNARAMPSSLSAFNWVRVCCINIVTSFGSVVVVGTAHVLVLGRAPFGERDGKRGLQVKPRFQDRQHGAARGRADLQCALTRGFEAVFAVLAREREQTETGAIAHLGMGFVG